MEKEIIKISIEISSDVLKEEISAAIRKFIEATDKRPLVTISNSATHTQCGILTSVSVNVYLEVD